MKKIFLGIIAGLILIVLCLCTVILKLSFYNQFDHTIADYNYQLTNIIKTHVNQNLPVTKLSNNDWTRVCFLGPYTQDSSTV